MRFPECNLPDYKYCPLIPSEEALTPLSVVKEQLEKEMQDTASELELRQLKGNLDEIQRDISYHTARQNAIQSCETCIFRRLKL